MSVGVGLCVRSYTIDVYIGEEPLAVVSAVNASLETCATSSTRVPYNCYTSVDCHIVVSTQCCSTSIRNQQFLRNLVSD